MRRQTAHLVSGNLKKHLHAASCFVASLQRSLSASSALPSRLHRHAMLGPRKSPVLATFFAAVLTTSLATFLANEPGNTPRIIAHHSPHKIPHNTPQKTPQNTMRVLCCPWGNQRRCESVFENCSGTRVRSLIFVFGSSHPSAVLIPPLHVSSNRLVKARNERGPW